MHASARLSFARLESKRFRFPAQLSFTQLLTNRYKVFDREALTSHFPITEGSRQQVTIDLIECSFSGCSTDDVLKALEDTHLRPATLAQVLHVLRRNKCFIDHRPLLCLGSIWTDRQGLRHTPLLNLDPSHLLLSVFTLEQEWWDPCTLHAVRD